MIVEEGLEIDVPVSAASARISHALQSDGLEEQLTAGVTQVHETLFRAGIPGVTKAVHLSTLPARIVDDTVIIAIRWESIGPASELFPSLDADLTLSRSDGTQTRLTLVGSYRPPLGRVGAALDRAMLHRVAQATMRNFLKQLAEIATSPVPVTESA